MAALVDEMVAKAPMTAAREWMVHGLSELPASKARDAIGQALGHLATTNPEAATAFLAITLAR